MDKKKKQTIEEIAKIIYKDFQAPSRYIAEQIYNAKYRKESDTAREILEMYRLEDTFSSFQEKVAKKYGVEVEWWFIRNYIAKCLTKGQQ